jgi:hypothetical protein
VAAVGAAAVAAAETVGFGLEDEALDGVGDREVQDQRRRTQAALAVDEVVVTQVHAQRHDPQEGGDPGPPTESLTGLDPDAHGHRADGAGDRGQDQAPREHGEDGAGVVVVLQVLGELHHADDGEDQR